MKRHSQKSLALILSATMLVTACSTNPYTGEREISNTAFGAGIGAAIGAIGGAIVGGDDKRKAILIGAGIGALAGGGVGFYMDRQEAKLREQLVNSGVQVVRDGDNIILNMPSNITFASGSSELSPDFENVLNSVSLVIKEYKKTTALGNAAAKLCSCQLCIVSQIPKKRHFLVTRKSVRFAIDHKFYHDTLLF